VSGYQAATAVQIVDEGVRHSPGYLEQSGC